MIYGMTFFDFFIKSVIKFFIKFDPKFTKNAVTFMRLAQQGRTHSNIIYDFQCSKFLKNKHLGIKKAHHFDELFKSGRRESNPRHQLGRLR